MRRSLIIAALVVLLSSSAFAQRGGGHAAGGHAGVAIGGHGFAGGMHSGFAGRGTMMASRGRGFGGFRAGSVHFGTRNGHFVVHSGFHGHFHDHFHFRGWGFPWAYYGYYDPGFYDDYSDYSDYQPSYDYAAGSNDQSGQLLQDEIDQLHDEVSRLREERDSRDASYAPSESRSKPEFYAETVLIFRDKHTQEVQNYAIVGKTIWVFNEQRATKIPLADLDIPATTKANDDRGIDFRVPTLNS